MLKLQKSILVAVAFVLLTGFWGDDEETPADKRKEIQEMRSDTLADLYKYQPQAKGEIKSAAGYAVFSNLGVNLLLLSTARGGGVAHDNTTGKDTYMKMFSAGGGIGLGVKDFRGIFIFQTKGALSDFINSGWQAGGQADADAKVEDEGITAGTALDIAPGVRFYQLTETGLALQATVQGAKYYKDDDLN